MDISQRLSVDYLTSLSHDDYRHEIIDGRLYVHDPTFWHHQSVTSKVIYELMRCSDKTDVGIAISAPGVILGPYDSVAPDIIWIDRVRLRSVINEDGHLTAAPELIAEILLPGEEHEQRDRVLKLDLYSRHGVLEYWILDWERRQVEVYRRRGLALYFVETLNESDTLTASRPPGFATPVASFFEDIPHKRSSI